MEDLKKEIVSNIRSCLISTKGQITLRQLENDYRTLLGERIPHSKLGFRTLEDFVSTIPSLITSRGPSGELFLDAQVSEKSAHISSMVRKQKSSGVKKHVRIAPNFNRNHAYPPPVTSKWRPKKSPGVASMMRRSYESSPRLAAVSHNQFVSGGGYKKPKVPSKVVVPERNDAWKTSPERGETWTEKSDGWKVSPPPKETRELRRYNSSPESPPKELKRYNSSPEKVMSNGSSGINGTSGGDEKEEVCSPLSSTMKRITRIMSEISVERDSGNSSPTMEFAATFNNKLSEEFARTDDAISDVKSFAAYHRLGEVEVKFTDNTSKKKVTQWYCIIYVGQHKYSSYPEDFFDKTAAERCASKKAIDDLVQRYGLRRRSLLLSSYDDILSRIPPMLEKHNNAVWMWQIEADYIDKYNEQLPADWLQIIDNSSHVYIEKCPGGYLLKHCNPDDKGKKLDISLNLGDVSVPCNTVNFGEHNRVYGVVTAAHSINEIWCQNCGTAEYERFVKLADALDALYSKRPEDMLVKNINFGSCYVILQEEWGWIRVRALQMSDEDTLDCFLIDYGEEVHVPVGEVYAMKREFALEQAQAFVCRLDGLEDLYDASLDSEHMTALVGREVMLEMVADESGESKDITIPVAMYDLKTSASINEELMSNLVLEAAVPILNKSSITEVFVSNIEPNGDVYIQVRGFGHETLTNSLKAVSESIATNPPQHLQVQPRPGADTKYYLVRCKLTQKWLRASIVDWSPRGDFAQIYYVDEGNTEVINILNETMYPVDRLDATLAKFPAQAVKVRIMIETIPTDFVQRAEKLLPHDQAVLLKIISYDNENVAWVEFFKRAGDVLVFVNKSISVEAELQSIDTGGGNNEVNSRKRLLNLVQFDGAKTVPSGGTLKKPDLPKIGDYFNVNIPFAVNPWNFFVQPLDTFNQLTALMADMQENYKEVQFSPMPIDDIIPGKIYASKHDDGLWYRTSVLKVINSGSISVFYCDFGYYTNLRVDQLIPLDSKYKHLPYQALKAKIAGIRPIKNKWTMEDCDVFNTLVAKKQFVSILVSIEKDELYKSDIILQLLLIDTSSEDDINIKEVLIERGIATSV